MFIMTKSLFVLLMILQELSSDRLADAILEERVATVAIREKAIKSGDSFVHSLETRSANFTRLNFFNSQAVATVLGEIRSSTSKSTLEKLYKMTPPQEFAPFVGAIGLSIQQESLGDLHEDHFLVRSIIEANASVGDGDKFAKARLAIATLGHAKSKIGLTAVIAALKNDELAIASCVALARIRATEAVPALRQCLEDVEVDESSYPFHALLILGQVDSIPLAIRRLEGTPRDFGLLSVLNLVAGLQQRGDSPKFQISSKREWEMWWTVNVGTIEVPVDYEEKYLLLTKGKR